MVEQGDALAGTITYRYQANPKLWTPTELTEHRAIYVSRLIVSRSHAGRHLGSALIDWAGMRGIEQRRADWIRIDVWTTNLALQAYYKSQGFEHMRTVDFKTQQEYPSAALFQKPTTAIDKAAAAQFKVVEEASLAVRTPVLVS